MMSSLSILIILIILIILSILIMLMYHPYHNIDFIDHIVYINLEDRIDRRRQIENELSIFPPNKIIRFNAIRDSPGHIGCSKSHIEVLKMAIREGWKNVLIVEDDAMWNNFDKGIHQLKKLITDHPDYDVITLGNIDAEFDKSTGRLWKAQTCTAYLVNKPYYTTLLKNFEEGLNGLLKTKKINNSQERFLYEQQYCIDQYWKRIQPTGHWYIVNPALMIQRPSKSSIEGYDVDYTNYFNL